jgi:outer membrane protein TolC
MRESLIAAVRAGAATPLADLARLDAELSWLARLRVEAEGRSGRASAQLGAWMDAELPAVAPAIDAPADQGSVERWVALALERHGALRAARARARAAEARADAAQAEATVPTFMVGASYMQMPRGRAGMGASVGMTLPWLWSGEGAARDASVLEAEAELDEVAALEREVRAEVRAAAAELHAASRGLTELRERERPAAERALEAIGARYPSGAVELGAWLDAARRVRDLDVEEARLLGDVARAWAALEGAVGDSLASEASDE